MSARAHAPNRVEKAVPHGLLRRRPHLRVVLEQVIDEIDRHIRHPVLILLVHKRPPILPLLRHRPQLRAVIRVHPQPVLLHHLEELALPEDVRNVDQLLVVVVAGVDETSPTEEHAAEDAAVGPHVEGVVEVVHAEERFGRLVGGRGDVGVEFFATEVEFAEAEVDEPQLAGVVVDHHVVGLQVAVKHANAVDVSDCAKKLVRIVSNVAELQSRIQIHVVLVLAMLED
mmetsp:Transcript_22855/g.56781  ORF Transcript_22855/g.56781 Transcript_22855/m.56781 type:complete len:228 (+) Transcript_22855:174-857(+)